MDFLMTLGTGDGENSSNDHYGVGMDPTSQSGRHRLAKPMRWAARAIALAGAMFFLTMLIGPDTTDGSEPITTEGVVLGVPGVIALAACVVSWWRERLAAILLIGAAVGLGIHIGVYAGHNHLLAWSMLGLPYLLAGLLLLSSWRLSNHDPRQHP